MGSGDVRPDAATRTGPPVRATMVSVEPLKHRVTGQMTVVREVTLEALFGV